MLKQLLKTMVAVLAIAAAATGPARAQSNTVRWEKYQISGFTLMQGDRQTIDDVTITSNGGSASDNGGDVKFNGAFTFSVPAGSVLTQIVIKDETWLSVTGWSRDGSETEATWTGSARSVACEITTSNAQYIEFTIASVVPQMYTSEVSITDLVPGDTLAEGATIIGRGNDEDMVYLEASRTKKNGVVQQFWTNLFLPPTVIGTNGTISGTYTPVDENGQDGTAWVVTEAVLNDYDGLNVGLAGIRIPGPPITVRMAAGTVEAANWTLASGNASVPGTQVLENVMSGSQVTATYNGTTKKVKSVKAVKYVPPVLVSSIVLNKQTAFLAKDSTLTLTASVLPENAADKSYTWSSDDITTATVNQNGVVTGVAGGTANIIATANDGSGVKDTCVVTVLSSAIIEGVTVLYASDNDTWETVIGYNPGVIYQDYDNVRLTSNGAFLYYNGAPVFVIDFIYPHFYNEYQWLRLANINGSEFFYHQGETWQQAISANRLYNNMWSINDGKVIFSEHLMLVDTNHQPVDPTATIDPSTVDYYLDPIMDN